MTVPLAELQNTRAGAAAWLSSQSDRVRELIAGFALTAALTPTSARSAQPPRTAQRAARNGSGGKAGCPPSRAARFDPGAVIPLDADDARTLGDF